MMVVIDASVAVKWLVIEERHEFAREVLRDGFVLFAPDLLLTEVANAPRDKVRAGLIGEGRGRAAPAELPRYFDRLFGPRETLAKAFEIALRINQLKSRPCNVWRNGPVSATAPGGVQRTN